MSNQGTLFALSEIEVTQSHPLRPPVRVVQGDQTFHPERAFLEGHLPKRIVFTADHHRAAAALAESRQLDCEARGSRPSHGFRGDRSAQRHIHLIGAYGECGYATYASIPLPVYTGEEFSRADFGDDVQVRTRTKRFHELYRRQTEPAEWRYVLVYLVQETGEERPTACYIRGWLPGVEMEREAWVQTHGSRDPSWFVPTADLRTTPVIPNTRPGRRKGHVDGTG